MLTKDDLNQISQIVEHGVEGVEKRLNTRLDQVETQLGDKIGQVEIQLSGKINKVETHLGKELKIVKEDIKKIRQDQNVIIGFFDNSYVDLRSRVEKLEEIVHTLTSH